VGSALQAIRTLPSLCPNPVKKIRMTKLLLNLPSQAIEDYAAANITLEIIDNLKTKDS
jgi:hypothetical protein